MSNSGQLNLLKYALLLIVLIEIALAQTKRPLLGQLVPNIQSYFYELVPEGDQYRLRITHPDGAQRLETVQLRTPGTADEELYVQGTFEQPYADNGARIAVAYEAGRNGYVAKVKYEGNPTTPTLGPFFISAGALKSAAG